MKILKNQIPSHLHPRGTDQGPFCKWVHLLQGPACVWQGFCQLVFREKVQKCVGWWKTFTFVCRLSANPAKGRLYFPCVCAQVAERQESFIQAGLRGLESGSICMFQLYCGYCLLKGYVMNNTHRDNCVLNFTIGMFLLSGDPCFKMPPSAAKSISIHCQESSCS